MGTATSETGPGQGQDVAAWGMPVQHESLWPARLAVLAAIALYFTLPDRLTVGPGWLPPLLELLVLAPLTIIAPVRHTRMAQTEHALSFVLIGLVNLANTGSLVLLLYALLHKGVVFTGAPLNGVTLLQGAVQIWLTNIVVFGLWYWFLDRGGPIERRLPRHREPDFLFPQMTTPECARPDWSPHFVDYLFLAFTNATAFSPTDTMPLTIWAKLLMMVQALISLLTVALVAARAVNILS